jgi:hypothetical protein
MGGCATRYRELSLVSDSVDDVLAPGEVKFYAFHIDKAFLDRRNDIVVRVHVRQGSGPLAATASEDGRRWEQTLVQDNMATRVRTLTPPGVLVAHSTAIC